MGQRVFIIALIASFCVALPTTDLVVPEAKDSGTSGAEVLAPSLALPSWLERFIPLHVICVSSLDLLERFFCL